MLRLLGTGFFFWSQAVLPTINITRIEGEMPAVFQHRFYDKMEVLLETSHRKDRFFLNEAFQADCCNLSLDPHLPHHLSFSFESFTAPDFNLKVHLNDPFKGHPVPESPSLALRCIFFGYFPPGLQNDVGALLQWAAQNPTRPLVEVDLISFTPPLAPTAPHKARSAPSGAHLEPDLKSSARPRRTLSFPMRGGGSS